MSKYKSTIGGSGKRTTNLFYRSGINSLLSRIEKLENQVFCCGDSGLLSDVTSLTANKTLGPADSGGTFVLSGSAITVTLPSAAAANKGMGVEIISGDDSEHVITSGTSDIHGNLISSGGGETVAITSEEGVTSLTLSAGEIGDRFTLQSDGTYWYVQGVTNAAVTGA